MLALLLLSEKALGDASNYAVYIKVRRFLPVLYLPLCITMRLVVFS